MLVYFVPFIVSNRYLLFRDSNGHNSVTVQNRTHVYMSFFDHKDLGNHLLQLCPKVVKHPVYIYIYISWNAYHIRNRTNKNKHAHKKKWSCDKHNLHLCQNTFFFITWACCCPAVVHVMQFLLLSPTALKVVTKQSSCTRSCYKRNIGLYGRSAQSKLYGFYVTINEKMVLWYSQRVILVWLLHKVSVSSQCLLQLVGAKSCLR